MLSKNTKWLSGAELVIATPSLSYRKRASELDSSSSDSPSPVLQVPFLKQTAASVWLRREVLGHHPDLHERIRSAPITNDTEIWMNRIEPAIFHRGYCAARSAMPVQVAAHHVEIETVGRVFELFRSHHGILLHRFTTQMSQTGDYTL